MDKFDDLLNVAKAAASAAPSPRPGSAQSATPGGNVAAFVAEVGPTAAAVGERIGVDPAVLIGQWGLETGWGKSVIPGTNNLGNIKAFDGSGVAATDNMTGSRDRYRQYASYDGFGADYAGLIERRYRGAIGAGADASRFGEALKAGGYAEDPDYVAKLSRAADMVRGAGVVSAGGLQSAPAKPRDNFGIPHNPLAFADFDRRDADAAAARELEAGRTWGEAAGDIGLAITGGAFGIAELVGTGVGLVTGDMDNVVRIGGEAVREWAQQNQSKVLQAHKKLRAMTIEGEETEAGKFFAYLSETLGSPALAVDFIAEQVPQLAVMGGAGRAAGAGAQALGLGARGANAVGTGAAIGAGSTMQGLDAAGQAYSAIMAMPRGQQLQNRAVQQLIAEGVEEREAVERVARAEALTAGAMSAGISAAVNALPGAATLERALAGGAARGTSRVAGALKGAAGEGASEAIDEMGGVGAANLAAQQFNPEQSLTEGMGEAAAAGALFAPFGGVAGAMEAPPFQPKPNSPLANAASAAAAMGGTAVPPAAAQSAPEGEPADAAAADASVSANEGDQRLAAVQSFVEDKTFLQALRTTEGFGKESVSELLAAYAKARNPNVDPLIRERALTDIERFIETFNSRPNFTMGGQQAERAAGTAMVPAADKSQARQDAPHLEAPDFAERDITPRPETPTEPAGALVAPEVMQAKRDADAAYDQAFQDLVKAEQLGAADADILAYQQALDEAKAQRAEMDARLEEIQQAIAGSRSARSKAARLAVLDQVLADPETVNPAERFTAELSRQGFLDSSPTADELATIERFQSVKAAAADPDIEPSAPNEMPADLVRERAAPVASTPRDRIAEVRRLVAEGWRPGTARDLVSPTGKRRNLNAAEFAAAREAYRKQQEGARAQEDDRSEPSARPAVAVPVQSEPEDRAADAPAGDAAVRAQAQEEVAENAAQPEQVAEEAPQAGRPQGAAQEEGTGIGGTAGLAEQADPVAPEDSGIAAVRDAVAAAEAATDTAPTDAMKAAGNYSKGKVDLHGQRISIETPKGAERSGVGEDGARWSVTMPASYGYFLGTLANDGDHVDVFLGPKPEAGMFWVVNQVKPDTATYDEPKVMLGYESSAAAQADYLLSFSGDFGRRVFGEMVGPFSVADLARMLPTMRRDRPVTGEVAIGGAMQRDSAPTLLASTPFATFEQLKSGLRINGDPASLKERLSAFNIAVVARKDGVTVPNRLRWDEARVNIPVRVDTYRVPGVPERLSSVTVEVMESGSAVLHAPTVTARSESVEAALSQYVESYKDAPAESEPMHQDAGQPVEEATTPVIAQAIKKSARNTPFNAVEARQWLVAEIDRAIADVPGENAELAAELAREKALSFDMKAAEKEFGKGSKRAASARETWELLRNDRIAKTAAQIGFVTFDVPGDGKFKVVNTVEKLNEFKRKVLASPGFARNPDRPDTYGYGMAPAVPLGNAPTDIPDIGNAIEIARLRGKDDGALLERFKEAAGGQEYDAWRAEQEAEDQIRQREAIERERVRSQDESDAFMAELERVNAPAEQTPAQSDGDTLSPDEAIRRMEWRDQGQRDGERRHTLYFKESETDRNGITVATLRQFGKGKWTLDDADLADNAEPFDGLKEAKAAGQARALRYLTREGYVKATDPTNDRDSFTMERIRDGRVVQHVFRRGDRVKVWMRGEGGEAQYADGDIEGISHAQRKAKVGGIWSDFGAIYPSDRQAKAADGTFSAISDVVGQINAKNGEGLTDADRILTLDDVEKITNGLRDGTLSVDAYKASFKAYLKSQDNVAYGLNAKKKDELLQMGGPMFAYRLKGEKKDRIVAGLLEVIRNEWALRREFGPRSFVVGAEATAQHEANKLRALSDLVEATTAEDLKAYADILAGERAESQQRQAQLQQAMAGPKTLEDFTAYINAKKASGLSFTEARMTLSPAQRAELDRLWATKTRGEREAREANRRTEVRASSETVGTTPIVQGKHTKYGHDLYILNLTERVGPDAFKELLAAAKRLGGDYSSYRGNGATPGWQFRTMEGAEAFAKLVAGDASDAQEVASAHRDAFEDDRSQSAVERLIEMADRMEERADESLGRDRKANTERRARFAAAAEAAASGEKAMARTMRNIAAAISNGTAQFLDRVRQKAQVEMLQSMLRRAQYDELAAKYPTYAEQEKHRGAAPTGETADYATFPAFTAYRSDLARLGRDLETIDGAKLLGQRVLKVADDVTDTYLKFAKDNLHRVSAFSTSQGGAAAFATRDEAERAIRRSEFRGKAMVLPLKRGQNLIVMGPEMARERGVWEGDSDKRITLAAEFGEELVAKARELNRDRERVALPHVFDSASANLNRLRALGIETPAELRAALREFVGLREVPAQADRIKQMERAMVGRRNDGLDFFPTPAGTAQEMIDAADIKEGMRVLEPSAGMGHIAEQIREVGAEPDVVEMSNDRRELLEAKGFNVVGRDFLDVTEGGYDRIVMNPPFSDRRDAEHVQHAYSLLKPGGRLVAIMGEGVFYGQDKKADSFRKWLDALGGTAEKLPEGTFMDPSLPVNTSVNARMVVLDKPAAGESDATSSEEGRQSAALYEIDENGDPSPEEAQAVQRALEGKNPIEAAAWLAENAPPAFAAIAAKVRDKLQSLSEMGVPFGLAIVRAGDLGEAELSGARGVTRPAQENGRWGVKVALNGADMTGRVGTSYRTALHELVHAATMQSVQLGLQGVPPYAQATRDLHAVANAVIAHINDRAQTSPESLSEFEVGVLQGRSNFLNDLHEVVAWALASPDAQAYLESIPYQRKSAWTSFVEAIRRLLGLSSSADTALSEVLRVSELLLKPLNTTSGLAPLRSLDGMQYETQHPADGPVFKSPGGLPEVEWTDSDSGPSLLRNANANPGAVNGVVGRVAADAFLADFLSRFPGAPEMIALNTFDQLPPQVQAEAKQQDSDERSTKGVFHRGKVYLVVGNHSSMADFEATVFHEVFGHAGVRAMFGPDFVQKLNQVYVGLGGQGGLVRIMNRRGMGNAMQRYIRGALKAQQFDADAFRQAVDAGDPTARRIWTDAMAKTVLTEEVFAHVAEQIKERPGLWDRFMELIGRVRQWLRDHGFAELAALGESDLLFMLSKARDTMRGPDGPNGTRVTRSGVTVTESEVFTPDGKRLDKKHPDFAAAMRLADLLGLREEPGVTVFSAARRVWLGVRSVNDSLVPETPEYEGSKTGDLAYLPGNNRVEGLPIRLPVGVVKGDHAGFGVAHIADNAAKDRRRAPPADTGDLAEDIAREVVRVLQQVRSAHADGRRWALYAPSLNKAVIVEIRERNGERHYSVVTVVPGEARKWGGSEWSGRLAFPDREAAETSPPTAQSRQTDESPRSDRKGPGDQAEHSEQETRTEHFDLTRPEGGRQAAVTVKKRRKIVRDDGSDGTPTVFRNGAAGIGDFAQSRAGRRAIRARIAEAFDAVIGGNSVRTFNWWNRTIGSQYHKAKKSPEFRRVYDLAHAFVDDVSRFANEAADHAKNILPHLDTWSDMVAGMNVRQAWADAKDYQAIAEAVFQGTLANGTTGQVWTDAQLRDDFELTDKQAGLYREFRAAVDHSLETLAASEMARAARAAKLIAADTDMGMTEALDFYTDQVDALIDTAEANRQDLTLRHEQEQAQFRDNFGSLPRAGAYVEAERIMLNRQRAEATEAAAAVAQAEALRASFTEKADQIRRLQAEGYAPLMRFGQYTVDVVRLDADGKPEVNDDGELDRPFFGMFESEAEARDAARILQEEYPAYTVTRGVMSAEANQLYKGITPETAEMFARLLGTDQEGAFQAYLKQAVANRSAMKRLIQRKGMAGFAQDVPRVLAAFITSTARLAAGNWHFGEMTKAAADIPQVQGDVKDEAVKLIDYVQNPREEAAGLRGFLFFSFLGGSVAAALVNTTQTFSTTLPYLHQFGPKAAADAITQAMGAAARAMRKGLDAIDDKALRTALTKAAEEGIIDPQEIHLLMAESGGNGASNFAGTIAGLANKEWATPASRVARSFTQAWGGFFGMAEKYNRHVAFMAAWDVAGGMTEAEIKAAGAADRYDFAKRAVIETQFDYTKVSRPNWARGAVGATLFTFKTFMVNYLEFIARLPARERAVAIAVLLLLAGMSGAPGIDDMEDIIDAIGQKFGYNWNSAAARHGWLMKTLGEGGANFVEHGVSSFMPIDVSARLGMGNIIPGTEALKKSSTDKGRDAAEVLGPTGSVLKGAFTVLDDVGTGKDFGELIRPVAPKAYGDLYQAFDILQTGYYRDSRGRKVVEAGALDAAMKAIGFQPNAVAEPRRVEWMIAQSAQMQRAVRSDIYELWSRGVFEQDAAKVALAKELLHSWNRKNPETPIRANPTSIAQRVKAMRASSAERMVKATPREMRGMIQNELAVTE